MRENRHILAPIDAYGGTVVVVLETLRNDEFGGTYMAHEIRDEVIWRPDDETIATANVTRLMKRHGIKSYEELITRSNDDIEWFWEAMQEDLGFEWFTPYETLLDTSESFGFEWAKWFVGGKMNISHNSLDRHALNPDSKNRLAFIWEGEDGEVEEWTYYRLYRESNKVANALTANGIGVGDNVGFYLPMIPELVPLFFGCLKVGAPFIPVFSGFGPSALAVRMEDAEAKMVFTADGSSRRGKMVDIKPAVDEAADLVDSVEKVVVVRRLGRKDIEWNDDRDLCWEHFLEGHSEEFETMSLDAEATSMILYSSGTTGKPKGTVHTHGGALAQIAKELGYAFDVKPDSRFFWVTDIGWMMGPWEFIGVGFHGGTYMIFEGAPNWPGPGRVWEMVEKHSISHLGISPTAIRLFMRAGTEPVEACDLSSLRILGSTGEPWDPDSYMWFFENVGGGRCPIINISGGTEMVGCLLSPLPIKELKPCSLQGPGLAMDIDVFNEEGASIRGEVGHLVCKKPCPSFTKGFLKDPERYIETYFSRWPKVWYHGDWAHVDGDGHWTLHGRSDDTIKVAGKRTGPAEIEAALIEHPAISEAAAIGVPHEIKGESVVCFAVLQDSYEPSEELLAEFSSQVVKHLGKTLRPEAVYIVTALPKTRSAKIVRGVIQRKYIGEEVGDLSSVENPNCLDDWPTRG